jgi:hypothetical protein
MNTKIDWQQNTGMLTAEFDRQNKEVLQIVNQRFTLITVAIGGTATVLGWMATNIRLVPDNPSPETLKQFFLSNQYLSLAGIVLLALAFALSFLLLRTVRLVTTSIIARYEDPDSPLRHENIWKQFRATNKYTAYSRPLGWVYFSLGIVMWIVPLLIRASRGPLLWYPNEEMVALCVSLYSLFVVGITEWRWFAPDEETLIKQWEKAIRAVQAKELNATEQ